MKQNADLILRRVPATSGASKIMQADSSGNSSFPSLSMTDTTNTLKFKIIPIGDWNMDSTASVNVAHGLTYANIRTPITALIRNDADSLRTDLAAGYTSGTGGAVSVDSTNVILTRGLTDFNNTDYDSTSYNRGWITIFYVV